MKKLIFLSLFFLGICASAQNYELSTLRIGEYKIFMKKAELESIAKMKIKNVDDYETKTKIKYYGETIEVLVYSSYLSEAEPAVQSIQYLATKSKKFRTKSGMGVGSTKQELLNSYINYANFSVNQSYDDSDPKGTSFLRLSDIDAGTELSFKMINNTVTEVAIYLNEGGC